MFYPHYHHCPLIIASTNRLSTRTRISDFQRFSEHRTYNIRRAFCSQRCHTLPRILPRHIAPVQVEDQHSQSCRPDWPCAARSSPYTGHHLSPMWKPWTFTQSIYKPDTKIAEVLAVSMSFSGNKIWRKWSSKALNLLRSFVPFCAWSILEIEFSSYPAFWSIFSDQPGVVQGYLSSLPSKLRIWSSTPRFSCLR